MLRRVTPIAVGLAAAGCSLLLGTANPQCQSDGDCAARGEAFIGATCTNHVCVARTDSAPPTPPPDGGTDAGPLYCLGNHPAPVPAAAKAKLQITFLDLIRDPQPATNLEVRLCTSRIDPACTNPTAKQLASPQGVVSFDVDTTTKAFDGWVDVYPVGADGGPGDTTGNDPNAYVPSRIDYWSVPIAADKDDSWHLLTYGAGPIFENAFKLPAPLKEQGSVFLEAVDCYGKDLAGVSFTIDKTTPETTPFYASSGGASATATSTDSSGFGGFVNVPVDGARTFTAVDVATGRTIGRMSSYAQANVILYALFGPSFD